jgi:hypothetical protein
VKNNFPYNQQAVAAKPLPAFKTLEEAWTLLLKVEGIGA